jgi:N-acetylneuraminic acid mutarotase
MMNNVSKPVALALVILFLLIASNTVKAEPALTSAETGEDFWTTKSSMPQAISGVKAVVVNGKIYVMAGTFNYEYDPALDIWTAKTPMPTPRIGSFGIAVCLNKIYVIGGEDEVLSSKGYYFLSTNEVYDPSTDTWETKKPMPTSREYVDANVVNGRIYVIGGITYEDENKHHQNHTAVNEVYDPATDSWTTKQPAPFAVARYASAVVDNRIYVFGGTSNQVADSQAWVSNQIYDAEADTWSFGASLPTATYHGAAAATTDVMAPERVYVIGGGFTEVTNIVNIYDAASDSWISGAPMPTNRSSFALAAVNDVIYAIGGSLGWEGGDFPYEGHPVGTTNVVEQYTPFGYGTMPDASGSAPTSPTPTLSSAPTQANASAVSPAITASSSQSNIQGVSQAEFYTVIAVFAAAAATALSAAVAILARKAKKPRNKQ